MPIPADWNIIYNWENDSTLSVKDPRGLCPYCRNLSTFAIQAEVLIPHWRMHNVDPFWIHLILKCNSISCSKSVYVLTSISRDLQMDRIHDYFFMHPSRTIAQAHPAVPKTIADDWTEAQKVMETGAQKAAAMMCRRVLYGVILDKKCKEHPLHEGLKQLIQEQRLPAIFDDWLTAIKDDGHDAAHPHRALEVDPENISETIEYTAELLRFLYIEPYEFQQRKARNAPKP
jgi:hypothetical protein